MDFETLEGVMKDIDGICNVIGAYSFFDEPPFCLLPEKEIDNVLEVVCG